jgi:hypothetical protein
VLCKRIRALLVSLPRFGGDSGSARSFSTSLGPRSSAETTIMPKDVSKAPKRQRNIILASSSVARCRDTDDVVPEASHAAPIYKHGVKHSLIHLSQWHVCEFTDAAGHKFRSVRQWVKWRKASVFDDTATADAILAAKTADSHTTLGRNANVRGFDQATWNASSSAALREGAR